MKYVNNTETIPHWLTKQASLHPDNVALELADGECVTFLQLKQRSEHYAYQLASLHIKKGMRVALLSTNHLDMVIAIHALSYLEAIAVLLNTRLTEHELTDQLIRSGAELLITTESLREEKALSFSKQFTFSEVTELVESEVSLVTELNLNTPFTMMYTSGTTGAPKGVIHTYGNHWWSAVGSVLNLGLHDDDKWLLTLPLFHVGGLSILIRSVMYGMTIFFMEQYNIATVKRALFDKKVTIASLVTLMLQQLVDEIGERRMPKHVRCILLGGGSVPETLLRRVEKHSIPLFQSYGMTETSSQIVTLSAAYARGKLGSAGKPLLPAQVKINAPDAEGVGEIIVKGPMVFHGYDRLPTENAQTYKAGWFYTGDLGYFDEDGFLYVVDRRTDLIISGGENIYPSEIEQIVLDYPGVVDVAVVGMQDDNWGQVPVAFVVAAVDIEEAKLITFIERCLASYKVPRHIIFTKNLPRNASNKVMRHRLAEKLNNDKNST